MMEKRLIVSMACGEASRKYSEITFPLIQKYAQKCNADFHAFYNPLNEEYSGYDKCQYINYLDYYDRIMHIDADMIVRSNTPNVFELVPDGYFGAVNELPYQDLNREYPPIDRLEDVKKFSKYYWGEEEKINNFYINVGMYLFSKDQKYIFEYGCIDAPVYFKEQTEINYKLKDHKVHLLDPKFNHMSIMEDAGLSKNDAYIIHYAGAWNGKTPEQIITMMKEDIK